jgi:hypothetical protein
VWASISNARTAAGALLYDPSFVEPNAPPPFNWVLTSSPVGLAERRPGGGLHVIFYGREDGPLARQLLVLSPGRYRMAISVEGNAGDAQGLTWSVRCDKSDTPLAAVPLSAAGRRLTFDVQGCPAQWIELSGISSDVSHQSDVTINSVNLVREQPNG